jgi:hypothetical protein
VHRAPGRVRGGEEVDKMTDEMRPGPEYGEHVTRALKDRGWHAFEVARFFRLPIDAQLVGLIRLDEDEELKARELLDELEEEVERRRGG